MKISTLPAIRVTPEVREFTDPVLKKGETLSMLVEDSLRKETGFWKHQNEFMARAIAAGRRARETGAYVLEEAAIAKLRGMLAAIKKVDSSENQRVTTCMKCYKLRFTTEAVEDLERLYDFLLQYDFQVAERAMETVQASLDTRYKFPLICRKANHQAFGNVTPTCPWYLPPRSLYDTSQTSSLSLSKNSTWAQPSPA